MIKGDTMIRDTFLELLDNKNVRQNLIQLKAELKIGNNKMALLYQIGGDYSLFYKLIKDEDPKVRKNTALIMGELGVSSFLDVLYEGYLEEEQLFVKSSYLAAMKDMDYERLIPELKVRLDSLTKQTVNESDKKHINEEIRTITNLILNKEGAKSHEFNGCHIPSKLVLLTNRNFKDITLEQLIEASLQLIGEAKFAKKSVEEIKSDIISFFQLRLKHLLTEEQIRYDLIDAVIGTSIGKISTLVEKAQVLEEAKNEEGFKESMENLSRVINISTKAETVVEVDTALFENDSERNLYAKFAEVQAKLATVLST